MKDKHSKTKQIMSKIDLSKAKIGDKFRTRCGLVLTYYKEYINRGVHILKKESGRTTLFLENGNYIVGRDMHPLDLVEQVFDDEKGRAITDKILKDVEKVVNGVAEAMPLIESAEIANLPRDPLPENNEDDAELQRRKEVIALAEKLVVNEEMMKSHKDLFEAEVHAHAKTQTTYPAFVIRSAEDFIKYKNQYLKDGKL